MIDDRDERDLLLNAYFDGELTGRPDLDALHRRVDAWLARHPEARAALAEFRRIDRAWRETTPADPGAAPPMAVGSNRAATAGSASISRFAAASCAVWRYA